MTIKKRASNESIRTQMICRKGTRVDEKEEGNTISMGWDANTCMYIDHTKQEICIPTSENGNKSNKCPLA